MISKSILSVVTVALLITNGLLIFRNASLTAELEKFLPKEVKEGNVITGFSARDLNDKVVDVNFVTGDRKRVFLYLSSQCGFCTKQMPFWKKLIAKADKSQYQFTAITRETDKDVITKYVNTNEIGEWDLLMIRKEDADSAEFGGTPTTIVVNSKGVVEKSWIGMWREREIAEARNFFGVDFGTSVIAKQK